MAPRHRPRPVDLDDPDAVRWLECCIWPDQPERLARLQAAVGIARADPPEVVCGDLLELVGPGVADAPADVTVVVFHAPVLVHLFGNHLHSNEPDDPATRAGLPPMGA